MFSPAVNQVFYIFSHSVALAVLVLGLRRMLIETRQPVGHAAFFAVAYVWCTFGAAKILFDVFKSYEPFSVLALLNPLHYLDPGFWGWMLAFLPTSLLYPFVFRLDRIQFYRALALAMPFVIVFHKTACLVSGCCQGVPSELPWAIAYPVEWGSPHYGEPVHPVAIYDVSLMLAIGLGLRAVDRREAARPYLYPAFFMLYSASRFLTEMFRPAYEVATSQRFEAVTVLGMLVLLTLGRRHWLRIVERAAPREVGTLQAG